MSLNLEMNNLEARFNSKWRPSDTGCHDWIGGKGEGGYGLLFIGNKKKKTATHVAWFIKHGEFPDASLDCLHKCDNPSCVNPDHLFLGTASDNIRDSISKGRYNRPRGENHPCATIDDRGAMFIRKNRNNFRTQKDMAAYFGVGISVVSKILTGRTFKHLSINGEEL